MRSDGLAEILKSKMVWICALGYLVDIYDLVLFGVVRVPSLRDLGIQDGDLQSVGAHILNYQMAGMLIGGFVWGLLGDKIGRVRILFASIATYSLANLLNALAFNIEIYSALRFLAGFGLAGELGIALTLVAEILPQNKRGYGTTIVGLAGFIGAIIASFTATLVTWRISYVLGGALGFFLLFLRLRSQESPLFSSINEVPTHFRGSLVQLFSSRERILNYFKIIMVGIPIWYISGILMYFAPEFAKSLGITGPVLAGYAILWNYSGAAIGDISSGVISQILQSRKRVILIFLGILMLVLPTYFVWLRGAEPFCFYLVCFLFGVGNGYWALAIGVAAELFGTNLRATVSTSVPNLIRGAVIPMIFVFQFLKSRFGDLQGAFILGAAVILVAGICLISIEETFRRDLNFIEK